MLIGIDGNEANIKNRVGVNTYAFEILWGLHKLQANKINSEHQFIIYLKENPLKDMPPMTKFWKYKILGSKKYWVATKLMPYLYKTKSKPDILFSVGHYLPPFCPIPAACSIMDLGYLEFSDQFKNKDYWQLRLWTARSLKVAQKIFSISESSKNEIVRHYTFARNKVIVTPLGYDKSSFNLNSSTEDVRRVKTKYNLPQNYILFLGTLKPSKNLVGLVKAWALVEQDFPEIKLVIAGKKGWLFNEIFETAKKLNLEERVTFTDFIPEKYKVGFIKGAKAFVMPSFWEGFGLDVVSAMASGIPVIVSGRGSLPEVVGNGGITVDPDNIDEIAGSIKKVLTMTDKSYNKLKVLGLMQASKFSWEKAAALTLKGLESIK